VGKRWSALTGVSGALPACEDRLEARFSQDAFDFFSFVSLDLNAPLLYRASNTAAFLHFLGESLFLRLPDSREVFYNRNGFSAAMRRLTDNVYASAVGVFLSPLGCLRRLALRALQGCGIRRVLGVRLQVLQPGKLGKRTVCQLLTPVR